MDHRNALEPIATCVNTNCRDCKLRGLIHCHFDIVDFAKFALAVLPSFLSGALGIRLINSDLILPWVALCVGFFGVIEIKVLCSHCPHYAEPGNFLRCWANHGSPKLWKYQPGPLSSIEKIILVSGLCMVWGYPLAFLIVGKGWLLLTAFVVLSVGFFVILKMNFCPRCMNFACPLNGVAGEERELFFELNPGVAEGWRSSPIP